MGRCPCKRFRTTRQFFRSAGYVVSTVDHGIITTFLHGSKIGSTGWGSRNFPSENAAAANTAGFDCVFAFGKSHNLVARGGIARGRLAHRHGDFQTDWPTL